jgi:hypothetical protein
MTGTVTATTTQPVGKQSRERIVVGVDGSKASTDALRWAARQAELMGALLEVVMVWEMPVNPWASSVPSGEDFATRARRVLRKTVVDVLGEPPETDVVAIATRGRPVPRCSTRPKGPTFSWSAAGGMAPSSGCSLALSANSA